MSAACRRCKTSSSAISLGVFLLALWGPATIASAADLFLDERFDSLDRWETLTFPKISRHSTYTIVSCETGSCLLMESDNSASGLVLKESFDVHRYPRLSWRWKVSNVYRKGDSATREGDDYPARLYVLFIYEPERASLAKRLRYQMAKTFYGRYPPDSSISYIWDNRDSGQRFIVNAYASEARMIPVSAGSGEVNTWKEYSVDILNDYRLAFGHDPPKTAKLAVMSDADNTRESARAWIDHIRLERPK